MRRWASRWWGWNPIRAAMSSSWSCGWNEARPGDDDRIPVLRTVDNVVDNRVHGSRVTLLAAGTLTWGRAALEAGDAGSVAGVAGQALQVFSAAGGTER